MFSPADVLSFMDLLDLDEEMIDSRLKTIMVRTSYTNKHLSNAIRLLEYKHLINVQEGVDCDNDQEYQFITKLISHMDEENVDNICKIVNSVLCLNKGTIVGKSEHLIQQIMCEIDFDKSIEENKPSKTLLTLKLCDSILDAVVKNGVKISLFLIETPLENILISHDNRLKVHFLTNTVPKLFKGIMGSSYNIFDKIWDYLKQLRGEQREQALKTLSCLSEFYLPVQNSTGDIRFESEIVFEFEFWSLLLFGLKSNDPSVRKISIYLLKRTIDCVVVIRRDVLINSETVTIFSWKHNNEKYKQMWQNFFILIDSLEEKQSNIVLPSLQLFESLNELQDCWLNCAFNIGLKHDNTQVKLKCIYYRLLVPLNSEDEAVILLESLNDINLYDHPKEYEILKQILIENFDNIHIFIHIFRAVAKVNWSPVPFYHITNVIADLKIQNIVSVVDQNEISQIVNDITKVSCNNIAIREAVNVHMTYFIGNCCRDIHWRELIKISSCLKVEKLNYDNPFITVIKNFDLNDLEKVVFYDLVSDSYKKIDLGLLYLEHHENDVNLWLNAIAEKCKKVQNIVSRQYSNKAECFYDVIFILQLFGKTAGKEHTSKGFINIVLAREHKTVLQYVLSLLVSDTVVGTEGISLLCKGLNVMSTLNDDEVKETLLQLYQSAVLLIADENCDIAKKIFAIHIVNNAVNNVALTIHYKHEMLTIKQFIDMINGIEFKEINKESDGRLRNIFYEKSCETAYHLLKDEKDVHTIIKDLIDYIANLIECGGYGCLKWILKIMNVILPTLLVEETDFNIAQFIDRMWKEIEELKSNNQYSPCIEEFVSLITQECLLKNFIYDCTITFYCDKIIEYGHVKNTPLYYLVKKFSQMHIADEYAIIFYILHEILLFSPVPRKDQRIADNVAVEILYNPKYGLNKDDIDIHFNFEIQYLSILSLCRIRNPEILKIIASFIMNKIDTTFKDKERYHGNSQLHRILLIGVQHLLLIGMLDNSILEEERVGAWSLELLGKVPHQQSVRLCLDWFNALHFYVKNKSLDPSIMQLMESHHIPIPSQFIILYWISKHKILNGNYSKEEYEFVMDTLLSHTMGQMFNVRLNAQYLATKLHELYNGNSEKFTYIVKVIEKTFIGNAKDKNFVKLKEDLFVNNFDIISHLTPSFIYYFLPKYCGLGKNEKVDDLYVKNMLLKINENIKRDVSYLNFKKEWQLCSKSDNDIFNYKVNDDLENVKPLDNAESTGIIQKKYIPWKDMSDIEVYDSAKKKGSKSELIVVASLIDKLPNLGGMARTSEVFGVKTYVVGSLRHLQEKQFQGLSVSAELWVNIDEVRPGQPLKDYLLSKKAEGYCLVAAEQTSTSCQLQNFKFPRKTLLLLGHEKEGIPCDLLPIMDHCVEIPQQGLVRSLNVHVTAAIFVWEYTRQNIL